MCKSAKTANAVSEKKPDVQYRDDFRAAPEAEKDALLNKLNANSGNYSVLIFTQNFKGEKVKVTNSKGKRLYNQNVISNLKTGIAGQIRIDNRYDTYIHDNFTGNETTVEAEEAKKYKFIYLMKNPGGKNPFTITYSNTLRPLE